MYPDRVVQFRLWDAFTYTNPSRGHRVDSVVKVLSADAIVTVRPQVSLLGGKFPPALDLPSPGSTEATDGDPAELPATARALDARRQATVTTTTTTVAGVTVAYVAAALRAGSRRRTAMPHTIGTCWCFSRISRVYSVAGFLPSSA